MYMPSLFSINVVKDETWLYIKLMVIIAVRNPYSLFTILYWISVQLSVILPRLVDLALITNLNLSELLFILLAINMEHYFRSAKFHTKPLFKTRRQWALRACKQIRISVRYLVLYLVKAKPAVETV